MKTDSDSQTDSDSRQGVEAVELAALQLVPGRGLQQPLGKDLTLGRGEGGWKC